MTGGSPCNGRLTTDHGSSGSTIGRQERDATGRRDQRHAHRETVNAMGGCERDADPAEIAIHDVSQHMRNVREADQDLAFQIVRIDRGFCSEPVVARRDDNQRFTGNDAVCDVGSWLDAEQRDVEFAALQLVGKVGGVVKFGAVRFFDQVARMSDTGRDFCRSCPSLARTRSMRLRTLSPWPRVS